MPGNYEIEVTKPAYSKGTNSVTVTPGNIIESNFALTGVPEPKFSAIFLDFGLELTEMSFTISNVGKGKLQYVINTSQDWISTNPSIGEATTETDIIKVIINRTGLHKNLMVENVKIVTPIGGNNKEYTISLYLNGVFDPYLKKHYKTVKIGTQAWMAENLIATTFNDGSAIPLVSGSPEWFALISPGYCWYGNDLLSYKDSYGALYNGYAVQTGKLCPSGWHVPTIDE
jgi:hypothetical protein